MFYVIPKSVFYHTNVLFTKIYLRVIRKSGPTCNLQLEDVSQNLRREHHVTSDTICPNLIRGIDHIRDPRLNKGLAFTLEERQALGVHGLLASSFKTQQEQLELAKLSINSYQNDLNKYLYLAELSDTNERLFYNLLNTDIEKYMPVIYTPTVGLACQRFGFVYRRPKGLFVTINDKGNVEKVIRNWPQSDVRAICFTDGERILGLGDLGAYGMGIPVGKLALYTALAGVPPHQCLPIMLDVGTNNESLLTDPLYIGLRQKRATGDNYMEFIDEFMTACREVYGSNTLLQFEDFSLHNATPLLSKYRDKCCTFNDDIQGTAGVVVAGLFSTSRITKKKLSEHIFMFLGAGSAATGIGNLIVLAMQDDGIKEEEGQKRIYMFDIDGILTTKRESGVPNHAKQFGKDVEPTKDFAAAVAKYKPTVLIGVSTQGGAFNANILKTMKSYCERPIVFALSNPTSKAECTPKDCYENTDGGCIYASGSPFNPFEYKGKQIVTGQGNNSYVFPGIALGVIACGAHSIPDLLFLTAAKSLASFVQQSDLDMGRVFPPITDIKKLSLHIAVDVATICYKQDIATIYPQPKDLREFITKHLYNLNYPSSLPSFYKYPDVPPVKLRSIEEVYRGLFPKGK